MYEGVSTGDWYKLGVQVSAGTAGCTVGVYVFAAIGSTIGGDAYFIGVNVSTGAGMGAGVSDGTGPP